MYTEKESKALAEYVLAISISCHLSISLAQQDKATHSNSRNNKK